MAALKLSKGGSGLDNLSMAGKLAVGVLFVLMVGAAYFVVFYGEIDTNITAQLQVLEAKKGELVQAKDADKAYNKDLTELERRKQLARRQRKILPDNAETPSFLDALQTIATITGIELVSWEPQDQIPDEFYARVPMLLKIEGKFHQVAKFFNDVGQVDRIINMENIVLEIDAAAAAAQQDALKETSNPQGEESINVKVTCLATAFRALKSGEGGGGKRKGRRGRGGKQ
jgi:type IV pilus assembly protein PilO